MRRIGGWLGPAVAWLVIAGVVGVLAAAVLVPRLAGATPYTVLTGSMQPSYPPGTLVVVRPVQPDEVLAGDVITYQLKSGEPTVVTHRVTEVAMGLDGTRVFTTKGDNNGVVDRDPVKPVQVQGKVWYSVPYLGYVNRALSGSQRQTAVMVVSSVLIGYAAFMLIGALRDRVRRRRHDSKHVLVARSAAQAVAGVAGHGEVALEWGPHRTRNIRYVAVAVAATALVCLFLRAFSLQPDRRS